MERRLAAILAADVVGYSRLMAVDDAATLATLTRFRGTIGELIEQRSGRLVGTAGDSILAEFPSVIEAVQCAVEIQQAIGAANADGPEDRRMLFRIGVNLGDIIAKDSDVFGDGVNVAARLQALAPPGGICISRAVRDQLRDKAPFVFEDLGERAVKNIVRPVRVFEVRFSGAPGPSEAANVGEAKGSGNPVEGDDAAAIELAFWDTVKNSETPADFVAYLERFPAGNFAALARTRLIGLTAAAEAEGHEEVKLEIAHWESLKDSDDPAMFRAYVERYSEGNFKELADARLEQLEVDGAQKHHDGSRLASKTRRKVRRWAATRSSGVCGRACLPLTRLDSLVTDHHQRLAQRIDSEISPDVGEPLGRHFRRISQAPESRDDGGPWIFAPEPANQEFEMRGKL
jgi:adenylate cyclase